MNGGVLAHAAHHVHLIQVGTMAQVIGKGDRNAPL